MPRQWDHTTRTYTETDEAGVVIEQRPYNEEENASADAIDELRNAETYFETLRQQALNALASNQQWRDNVVPQIIDGATTIETHASSSEFDKNLASGLKSVTNQTSALTGQVNALIRLVLRQLPEGS